MRWSGTYSMWRMILVFSRKVLLCNCENSDPDPADMLKINLTLTVWTDPQWSQLCALLDQGWDAEHPTGLKPNLEHRQFWCLERLKEGQERWTEKVPSCEGSVPPVQSGLRGIWIPPFSFYKYSPKANAPICSPDPRAEHKCSLLHWENIQDRHTSWVL